jgi:hypothetical protein
MDRPTDIWWSIDNQKAESEMLTAGGTGPLHFLFRVKYTGLKWRPKSLQDLLKSKLVWLWRVSAAEDARAERQQVVGKE